MHLPTQIALPARIALPALVGLAACAPAEAPIAGYAFVGSWDCEVETFTFTNTSYHNGAETLPIKAVEAHGRDFTLYFADGYLIALAAVTETGMTWVSGATGDQFNCKRVN